MEVDACLITFGDEEMEFRAAVDIRVVPMADDDVFEPEAAELRLTILTATPGAFACVSTGKGEAKAVPIFVGGSHCL